MPVKCQNKTSLSKGYSIGTKWTIITLSNLPIVTFSCRHLSIYPSVLYQSRYCQFMVIDSFGIQALYYTLLLPCKRIRITVVDYEPRWASRFRILCQSMHCLFVVIDSFGIQAKYETLLLSCSIIRITVVGYERRPGSGFGDSQSVCLLFVYCCFIS